jgi:hypothetical protein
MSIALPRPDILLAQTIRKDTCLTLKSAGNKIPIKNAMMGKVAGPMTMPAMARPLPLSRPTLLLILINATMPRAIAGIAVIKQVKGARMPSTSDAVARPLVLACWAGPDAATPGSAQLQNRQDAALSGFSVLHFGHRILFPFQFKIRLVTVERLHKS